MPFKAKKLLLVFELNNTLLHIQNIKTKDFKAAVLKPITIHQKICDDQFHISYRKGQNQFLDYFFQKEQKNIDVAIWTNLNHAMTQTIIKKYFTRHFRQLLFVMATDRSLYGADNTPQTNIRIKKQLSRVYTNFAGYNEGNTLIVSSNENLLQNYKKNDVIVPQYNILNPQFEVDPGMMPFVKYMQGVIDAHKNHNLEDVRTMIAAKSLASMFKRSSHNMYSEREYS